MALCDHDLIAKGQFHFAVCAAVVHLKVVAVAFFVGGVTTGRGRHHGVGDDGRGVIGLHGDGTRHVQRVNLAVVRLQDEGLRIGADHVGGQHHAGGRACTGAAGLVAGSGRERGLHAGNHVQVATQLKLHRFSFGQSDQGVFVPNVGANQRIHGLEQHVLRSPTHGVESQGGTHRGSARAHGGGVFGRDVGHVVGLNGQAAIGLDLAVGQQGPAGSEHHVVGDQSIDGHGR